jgi:hypothetical protein
MPKIKRLCNFSRFNFHRIKRGQTLEQHYNTYNDPIIFKKPTIKDQHRSEIPNIEAYYIDPPAQDLSTEDITIIEMPVQTNFLVDTRVEEIEEVTNESNDRGINMGHQEAGEADEAELLEYIRDSNSLEETSAALISFYLSGKLTQSALKKAIALIRAFCPDKQIPSSLDQCISLLYKILSYKKSYYCKRCKTTIDKLSSEFKQRKCSTCQE